MSYFKFLVIIISIPSSIVADYFNVPLAWMLGPMLVISIAALNGLNVVMPKDHYDDPSPTLS